MKLRLTLQTLAERLLTTLPMPTEPVDWDETLCSQWIHDGNQTGHLRALSPRLDQTFDGLIGVEKQIESFRSNIDLFMRGLPANASGWASQPSGHVLRLKAAMQSREKSWPELTQTHNKII